MVGDGLRRLGGKDPLEGSAWTGIDPLLPLRWRRTAVMTYSRTLAEARVAPPER